MTEVAMQHAPEVERVLLGDRAVEADLEPHALVGRAGRMVADDGEHRVGRDEAADGEGHGAEAEKGGRQRTKITDKSHVRTLADGDEPAKARRDSDGNADCGEEGSANAAP